VTQDKVRKCSTIPGFSRALIRWVCPLLPNVSKALKMFIIFDPVVPLLGLYFMEITKGIRKGELYFQKYFSQHQKLTNCTIE